ncbi:MAG: EAL domain-containing protein [Alphaproteobacteria bacterium]|nr:EAL domain-containing protein [Alphaproteobacteria bacterium]
MNSIRIRFTVLVVAFVVAASALMVFFDVRFHIGGQPAYVLAAIIAATAAVPGVVTYMMTGKLTGLIHELRRSAEAIAAGNFDEAVSVSCACEIGGLADSFRSMVDRLNSNILRMNILAYTDRVTELPNRAVIHHVLNKALEHPRKAATPGALMFIDLDKFKQVNDTLGHDAGDELLRQASLRILSEGLGRTPDTIDNCMTAFGELCDRPPTDIVFARFAGDEFVAFLPRLTGKAQLTALATRIIAALERPFRIDDTDVLIGASIGMACAPQDTLDPDELLNFADLAMYAAKQAGRGRFAFFDGSMRELTLQRAHIERDLRNALANDRELTVHFQPKISSRDMSVQGVEALVRWCHPTRGLLLPRDFIEVAEQTGLIVPLGDKVLELAMRQAAAWHRAGQPIRVSVNVSHLQFIRPGFVGRICGMLRDTGAPVGAIEIELTESTAMRDPALTRSNLAALRDAGVLVAIDDFGCGFSNLSVLAQLPFDVLKVDRSLVESIGVDAKGESVVRAIIGMGHSLSVQTIAEGVESLRQLSFLQHHGCDIVQGFLFARPMTADALEAWLATRGNSPVAAQIASAETRLRVS